MKHYMDREMATPSCNVTDAIGDRAYFVEQLGGMTVLDHFIIGALGGAAADPTRREHDQYAVWLVDLAEATYLERNERIKARAMAAVDMAAEPTEAEPKETEESAHEAEVEPETEPDTEPAREPNAMTTEPRPEGWGDKMKKGSEGNEPDDKRQAGGSGRKRI